MNRTSYNSADDLKGAGQIAVDGIVGITNIVEALHFTIVRLGVLGNNENRKKVKGLSGFIYNMIRAIAVMTGYGVDHLLDKLQRHLGEKLSTQKREALVSIVNGVLGDYLDRSANPLSIRMSFRSNGHRMEAAQIKEKLDETKGKTKLLIMVHGLCMNDLQWNRNGKNYAESLTESGGYLPIYLHYNSGRHISENGEDFAELLESLHQELDRDIELILITHSMGGLVTRSALHQVELHNYSWLLSVKKVIFLGTPHKGAVLERGGNWFETLLDKNPYSAPFTKLGAIRSAGITDLRYVNLTKEDWYNKDRFDKEERPLNHLPLPEKIEFYVIAAANFKKENKLKDHLIGDGLVSVESAFGIDKDPELSLHFLESNKKLVRGINHMELLGNEEVNKHILEFCE